MLYSCRCRFGLSCFFESTVLVSLFSFKEKNGVNVGGRLKINFFHFLIFAQFFKLIFLFFFMLFYCERERER